MTEPEEIPHPDLERLLELKKDMSEGDPNDPDDSNFSELFSSSVDEMSMLTIALTTLEHAAEEIATMIKTKNMEKMPTVLLAFYADAFITGVQFEKRGGHREPDG